MQCPKRINSCFLLPLLFFATSAALRAQTGPVNLALNKPALASLIEGGDPATAGPQLANDGDPNTRWAAGAGGTQWWAVDLGASAPINRVRIVWEAAYASGYEIRVSPDPLPDDATGVDIDSFTTVQTVTGGNGGTDVVILPAGTTARSVAVVMKTEGAFLTYSMWEAEVYNSNVTVSGTISDASGPLANALVSLSGPDTFEARTNAQGQYAFPGLLPGDYTLNASMPGRYAPASEGITLASDQSLTKNFTLSTPVVATLFTFPFYTADWIAIEGQANDFTPFTGSAYPADALPAPATVNGIPFTFGPTATGANNVFATSGATFLVPQGNYSSIYTLHSSEGGAYVGTVTLSYADGSTQQVPFQSSDWFGSPVNGEQPGIAFDHLIGADGARTNETDTIRLFQGTLPVDSTKVLQSFSFSAPQTGSSTTVQPFLFAITLESLAALPTNGTIVGQVNGPSGAVAGATVRVGPYELTTSATGGFSLTVPSGNTTVTAFKAGEFTPVSQNVTVAAGGTQTVTITLSARPQFVQYPLFYTEDWASGHENPGDYFAADYGYPSESLPQAGTFTPEGAGISYAFPSTADGARNVVLVDGQNLPVPSAHYSALYMLESAAQGTMSGPVTLNYSDGTTEQVSATFTDWFGSPSANEKIAIQVDHRHNPTNAGSDQGSQIKIYSETLPVNMNKVLTSVTLPPDNTGNYLGDATAFLWAMTLEAIDAPQTGTVTGAVSGPGGPVEGALVTLGGFGQVTTDAGGKFTIPNAPVGSQTVRVIAPGAASLTGATATASVTAGATATVPVTLAAGPAQVFSVLGATDYESGLHHIDRATLPNSLSTVVTMAGKTGRQITDNNRLHFDVSDSFKYWDMSGDSAFVQVEYLDQGTDTFALRYNAYDVTNSDYNLRYAKFGIDTESGQESVTKTGTGLWKMAVFELPSAGFYGLLHLGADFYVNALTGPEVIRSVVVSKTDTFLPIPEPTGCKGDADGSGSIDVGDAVTQLRHITGIALLTGQNLTNADANGDGGVDVTDAVGVLQAIVGIDNGMGINLACGS